jgi:hypothetical protein
MSLMVGVAPVNLEGTSNGSGPLRLDGVDGALSRQRRNLRTRSFLPQ